MFMKIAEIREINTKELVERIEAEVAGYNQMVLNHSISPLDNPAQIKPIPTSIAPTSRYNDIRPDTSVLACNKTISNMIFIYKGESSIPHSIQYSSSLQTTDSTFLLFRR